jgi:hypothetical protein
LDDASHRSKNHEASMQIPGPSSFETLAEFIVGPRLVWTRWQTPQDEGMEYGWMTIFFG